MKIAFFIFVIATSSVYCSGNKLANDKKHFNAFLEEIYGTAYKMDDFVDLMWPKIQEIVPETVELPAIEIYDISTDHYMCATSITAKAKLGKMLSTKMVDNTKEKITFEVEAALHLDAKPVEFDIAMKLPSGKVSPTLPVRYHFEDPFTVRLTLEVQNFLGQKQIPTPSCIMRIKSIMVVGGSDPIDLSTITDESSLEIEEHFLENFSDEDCKVLGTVGLVKAVNEQLKAKSNYWICSSKDFDSMQQEYKKEWEYSENYNKYCGKKGKN